MKSQSISIDPEQLLEEARWVRRLARNLVRDASLAEDLVQETWVAALESAPSGEGRLRPWLARVVRNFARQSRRGEANRAHREEASARSERSPSASETAERLEAQRLLVEALEALAEPYRTTVTLRYLEGLSAAQIARRQKIPAGTVRWRLKQGLDDLRARLDQRFGGERKSWAVALLPLLRRPPLAEIAAEIAQISSGSAAAVVEGVMMMNTLTKVGIAAALVVTASVGVWVAVDRPAGPLDPIAVGETAPPEPALAAPPVEDSAHALAAAPSVEPRESATETPSKAAAPASAPAAAASTEARVEARFLDRQDHAVEGVKLVLRSFTTLPPAISGSDGRAHIEVDLEKPTISTEIVASHAGLATYFGRVSLDRGRTAYLGDVRLEPGGSVAGWVLGPDGAPARDVRVLATSPEMQRGIDEWRTQGPETTESVPTVITLPDGSFRIDGVRAGSVRVWAGGEDTRWSFSEPIDVPENSVHGGIELRLQPLLPEDQIAGVVLTPEGLPVPHADVH